MKCIKCWPNSMKYSSYVLILNLFSVVIFWSFSGSYQICAWFSATDCLIKTDDSEFTSWSVNQLINWFGFRGSGLDAAIHASVSMNMCTFVLMVSKLVPVTLHLALCTHASCFVLPLRCHGFVGDFSGLRVWTVFWLLLNQKIWDPFVHGLVTTHCAQRFAEFVYRWFSGLPWAEYYISEEPQKNRWKIQGV